MYIYIYIHTHTYSCYRLVNVMYLCHCVLIICHVFVYDIAVALLMLAGAPRLPNTCVIA